MWNTGALKSIDEAKNSRYQVQNERTNYPLVLHRVFSVYRKPRLLYARSFVELNVFSRFYMRFPGREGLCNLNCRSDVNPTKNL